MSENHTKRFYVTMTWEEWPNRGSYGTVVEASNSEEATRLCMLEMADCEDGGGCLEGVTEEDWDTVLDQQDWHVVDCMDLDEFIRMHTT